MEKRNEKKREKNKKKEKKRKKKKEREKEREEERERKVERGRDKERDGEKERNRKMKYILSYYKKTNTGYDLNAMHNFMQNFGISKNFACYGGAFSQFAKDIIPLNKNDLKCFVGVHINDYFFCNRVFKDNFIKLISFSRWHILVYLSNNELYCFTHSHSNTISSNYSSQWKRIYIPTYNEIISISIASCNYQNTMCTEEIKKKTKHNENAKKKKNSFEIDKESLSNMPNDFLSMCAISVIDKHNNLYLALSNNTFTETIRLNQVNIIIPKTMLKRNLNFSTLFVSLPEFDITEIENEPILFLKYAAIFEISYERRCKKRKHNYENNKNNDNDNDNDSDSDKDNDMDNDDSDKGNNDSDNNNNDDSDKNNDDNDEDIYVNQKMSNELNALHFSHKKMNKSSKPNESSDIEKKEMKERNCNKENKKNYCINKKDDREVFKKKIQIKHEGSDCVYEKKKKNSKKKIIKTNEYPVKENDNHTHANKKQKRTKKNDSYVNKEEIQNDKTNYQTDTFTGIFENSNDLYSTENGNQTFSKNNYYFEKNNKTFLFLYIELSDYENFKLKLNKFPKKLICGTSGKHGCILFEDNDIYFWLIEKRKKKVVRKKSKNPINEMFGEDDEILNYISSYNVIGNIIDTDAKEYVETNHFSFQQLRHPKCKMLDVVYCNNTYVMLSEDKNLYILKKTFIFRLKALNIFFYLSNPTFKKSKLHYCPLQTLEKIKKDAILKMFLTDYVLVTVHNPKDVNFLPIIFKNIYEEDNQWINSVTVKCADNVKQLINNLGDFEFTEMEKNIFPEERDGEKDVTEFKMIKQCVTKNKKKFALYASPDTIIVCMYNLIEHCDFLNSSISDFLRDSHVV